jgi:hypothetical protein
MSNRSVLRRIAGVLSMGLLLYAYARASDGSPRVVLVGSTAGPRVLEPVTGQALVRAYSHAWESLARAFDQSSEEGVGDYFVGPAKDNIVAALASQRKTGLRAQYRNQVHQVEIVFYAPEGDVLELRDTAEYDLQLADRETPIHDEHLLMRYLVLMTPSADRWVVRQIQAVPQF